MKLSEAMAIMCRFARGGHIDPDLFEIFLRQKVYDAYAVDFLVDDQRDAVDTEALLSELRAKAPT
jgi:HD-GYP domain-containing protein (c-di-GMP phosphodiesterase class II)